MQAKQPDPWIGKALGQGGRYRLEHLLGSGSGGRVYRAVDQKLTVGSMTILKAVKILAVNLGGSNTARERFRREMQACMSLNDSHIVQVQDYGLTALKTADGQPLELPFMVMDYVEGTTLTNLIREMGKLSLLRAVRITRQIATALQVVHSGTLIQGQPVRFVHRDLKPDNIFILQDAVGEELVKLGDFGLVKFLGDLDQENLTRTGKFGGTAIYASPEQCHGSKAIDGRTDLYSLGCILYEMLSGQLPFGLPRKAPIVEWMKAHLKQNPLPFPEDLHIPKGLEALVLRCLEKDPASRFSTARELEAALSALEQTLPKPTSSYPLNVGDLYAAERTLLDGDPDPFPFRLNAQSTSQLIPTVSLIQNEILDFLDIALSGYRVQLQMIQREQTLNLMINRLGTSPLDHEKLFGEIAGQIEALNLSGIHALVVYSRPAGSLTPDWQYFRPLTGHASTPVDRVNPEQFSPIGSVTPTLLPTPILKPTPTVQPTPILKPTPTVQPTPIVESPLLPAPSPIPTPQTTSSINDIPIEVSLISGAVSAGHLELMPQVDLTQYSFVRNSFLIRSDLPPPSTEVAQLVMFFHELNDIDKSSILPVLTSLFKDPRKTSLEQLPTQLKEWATAIASLDDHKFKSVGVWLSRYCADTYKTLSELNAVLSSAVEKAAEVAQYGDKQEAKSVARDVADSQVLYQSLPHWWAQSVPFLLFMLAIIDLGLIIPSGLSDQVLKWFGVTALWPRLILTVLLLIVFGVILKQLTLYRKNNLQLTRSFLLINTVYLFKKETVELALNSINKVLVYGDWIGDLLGFGHLKIVANRDQEFSIRAVRSPSQAKTQIEFMKQQYLRNQQQQEAAQAAPVGSSNDQKPINALHSTAWSGLTVGEGKRYRLEQVIGRGGMGVVYKSTDQKLSIQVAIKFMVGGVGNVGTEEKERFYREMQACLNLQDNRIVRIFDFGVLEDEHNPMPFYVMEYVVAPTLEKVIRTQNRLSVGRTLNIGKQIAAALQVVHNGVVMQGKRVQFVHRDLKPANVFLIKDAVGGETIKLGDFGLVKFQGELSLVSLSQAGEFRGTPNYAAPEQCEGSSGVDRRADIYSLGCILYEMLAGKNPFDLPKQATVMQWIYAHVHTPPKPFPIQLGIPSTLEAIVQKCLAKDPAARFNSVLELTAALDQSEMSS